MKIRYFPDTDTAYVELSERPVAETREMSENILADLGADGRLVALTLEHASNNADVTEFSYRQMTGRPA